MWRIWNKHKNIVHRSRPWKISLRWCWRKCQNTMGKYRNGYTRKSRDLSIDSAEDVAKVIKERTFSPTQYLFTSNRILMPSGIAWVISVHWLELLRFTKSLLARTWLWRRRCFLMIPFTKQFWSRRVRRSLLWPIFWMITAMILTNKCHFLKVQRSWIGRSVCM